MERLLRILFPCTWNDNTDDDVTRIIPDNKVTEDIAIERDYKVDYSSDNGSDQVVTNEGKNKLNESSLEGNDEGTRKERNTKFVHCSDIGEDLKERDVPNGDDDLPAHRLNRIHLNAIVPNAQKSSLTNDNRQFVKTSESDLTCGKETEIHTCDLAIQQTSVLNELKSDDDVSCKVSYDKTIPGIRSFQPSLTKRRSERFITLYRLLRPGERIEYGLSAKDHRSTIDVVMHVAYGSGGHSSKYISTSANLNSAKNLRNISYDDEQIVSISVDLLPDNVEIIPLITNEDREKHINYHKHDSGDVNRYTRFASRFQEVLLVGYVPSNCLSVVVH